MTKILPAGTVAPGFTLRVTPDQYLSLSDLAGRPVVLAFYPADWSPVCGDQMALYNEVLPNFISTTPRFWAFRLMGPGVTRPLLRTADCTFRSWPISILKVRRQSNMARIGKRRASANVRYSLSIAKA